jgi:hypothetical protein
MAPHSFGSDQPPHARVTLGAAVILAAVLGMALLQILAMGRLDCREPPCASPAVQAALLAF